MFVFRINTNQDDDLLRFTKSITAIISIFFAILTGQVTAATFNLDEGDFFTKYKSPVLITDFYDRGDNLQPDSWVIRGAWGSGGFWEDVSFGYERGLDGPYPIVRDYSPPFGRTPSLSIMTPDTLTEMVSIAVYTDLGFFGIVPDSLSDRFYMLPNAVTTIYGLYTVSPVPIPAALWLFGSGLLVLFGSRRSSGRTESA